MIKPIAFAHIAPISLTAPAIEHSEFNMVLAHIADKSHEYSAMFKASDKETLLDNGAFELGVPYGAEHMVRIGHEVGADIMVLPDYPFAPWQTGWKDLEQNIKTYKDAGFKTMFVPQSLKGDNDGYMYSIKMALEHPDIDYIGISILGAPNAFDKVPEHKVRDYVFNGIRNKRFIEKRFHVLGMLGSVDEIERLTHYSELINSWDTSAAYWYGMNGLSVQGRTEKFKDSVDFDSELEHTNHIDKNVAYMKGLR